MSESTESRFSLAGVMSMSRRPRPTPEQWREILEAERIELDHKPSEQGSTDA